MIAIIGAGITGLTVAEHLIRHKKDCYLFEASPHLGGNMQSFYQGNYLLEKGPNSLRINDDIYAFLEELGIHEDILYTHKRARFRFVLKNGKYQKLPSGLLSFLFSSFFSFDAKKQLWKERNIPPEDFPNESIANFFRRRFGEEITTYVVAPFISGIFAGDPEKLLIKEAFSRVWELERKHRSVVRGAFKQTNKQKKKGIISFPKGLGYINDAIVGRIKSRIKTNHRIEHIRKTVDGFHLFVKGKSTPIKAQQLVSTLPAYQLAPITQEIHPAFSKALEGIYYPPVSLVYTAFKRQDVGHKLNGFGALHNHKEPSHTLGTIFSSSLFEGRCPTDEVLLTTFVGGCVKAEKALQPPVKVKQDVLEDLRKFLDISGEPTFQHMTEYPKAIPQYDKNILAYRPFIPELQEIGIHIGGNWVSGISVGDCILYGKKLAHRLLAS